VKPRLRPWVLRIHLWGALVLGLLLAVICLSGSLAVLRFDIDQMVHGRGAQDGGEPASWDRVIATAQAGDCPLADDELDWIAAPRATGGAIELWYRPDGGDYQRRFLCPVRGSVLGDTRGHWLSASMAWIAELHRTLLLGAVGGWLLGIGAFALLGFVATGLYLWWPSLRRGWAAVGRIRWGTGSFLRHYDTHQVVAIWCIPVFVLVATTGAMWEWRWFDAGVQYALGANSTELGYAERHIPWRDAPFAGRDGLVAAARAAVDGEVDEVTWLGPYPEPHADETAADGDEQAGEAHPLSIYFAYPGVMDPYTGGVIVSVDPWTGAVLDVDDPRTGSLGKRMRRSMFALHAGWWGTPGSFWAWTGRILYILVGIAPTVLLVTGLGIWRHRRRQRRSRDRMNLSGGDGQYCHWNRPFENGDDLQRPTVRFR